MSSIFNLQLFMNIFFHYFGCDYTFFYSVYYIAIFLVFLIVANVLNLLRRKYLAMVW